MNKKMLENNKGTSIINLNIKEVDTSNDILRVKGMMNLGKAFKKISKHIKRG